jgi:hypothetical protein
MLAQKTESRSDGCHTGEGEDEPTTGPGWVLSGSGQADPALAGLAHEPDGGAHPVRVADNYAGHRSGARRAGRGGRKSGGPSGRGRRRQAIGVIPRDVAMAMATFERELQANVAIALFIPALVYLTAAIGTQIEAIAIRGLSVRRTPLPKILLLELVTGA